ncbi:hypothetical protein B0H14DRAFT_2633923, partial [Mycena olivaceomarginata]
ASEALGDREKALNPPKFTSTSRRRITNTFEPGEVVLGKLRGFYTAWPGVVAQSTWSVSFLLETVEWQVHVDTSHNLTPEPQCLARALSGFQVSRETLEKSMKSPVAMRKGLLESYREALLHMDSNCIRRGPSRAEPDSKALQVRTWRWELQEAFLGNAASSTQKMTVMDVVFTTIENFKGMTLDYLVYTTIKLHILQTLHLALQTHHHAGKALQEVRYW